MFLGAGHNLIPVLLLGDLRSLGLGLVLLFDAVLPCYYKRRGPVDGE